INKLIQNGVNNMPSIPEMLALNIAAAILPFAIETITTDAETVEGNVARKNVASQRSCWLSLTNGFAANTTNGNKIKVAPCINTCSFQFFKPAFILSGLSFKP